VDDRHLIVGGRVELVGGGLDRPVATAAPQTVLSVLAGLWWGRVVLVWLWAPVTVSARLFRVDWDRSRWAATGFPW